MRETAARSEPKIVPFAFGRTAGWSIQRCARAMPTEAFTIREVGDADVAARVVMLLNVLHRRRGRQHRARKLWGYRPGRFGQVRAALNLGRFGQVQAEPRPNPPEPGPGRRDFGQVQHFHIPGSGRFGRAGIQL